MGCDIHIYIEKKVRGKWQRFTEIDENDYPDERNYDVFSLLAGVTGSYGKVYFPNRGIPDDCSYIEPTDDEDDDDLPQKPWLGDHSFTYATIHELKKIKWENYMGYEPQFARFIKKYFPLKSSSDKNVRIVMGFDS